MAFYDWKPYVPVAQRRANAMLEMEKLKKKGIVICPIKPFKGRKIAQTFWGDGWCKHLEQFSDFDNRLPRGRTYVRNGSVCHLGISKGHIHAYVAGSELYEVNIKIKTIAREQWANICQNCTGRIGSLLELLQGRFSNEVMQIVTDPHHGLFPLPDQITLNCSCPDWASMCKHVAAVLYGVGARLDQSPELIFTLRGVDTADLISTNTLDAAAMTSSTGQRRRRLKGDVAAVFGVELDASANQSQAPVEENRKAIRKPKSKRPLKSQPSKPTQSQPALTGKAIAILRENSGMTVAQFAEYVNVSIQTIYNWEKKKGVLRLYSATEQRLRKLMSSA